MQATLEASKTLLGIGLYTIPEAARLLRINPQRLRRWVEGYTYQLRRAEKHASQVLPLEIGQVQGETVLTFQDLIELYFIHLFTVHGVSLPVIRAAAKRASEQYQRPNPFTIERFQTDGKVIFSALQPTDVADLSSERVTEETHIGQIVIGEVAQPFYRKLEYDNGLVQGWWPLGKDRRVILDPKRAFGKPIDAETSVPTNVLYEMVLRGESSERVASWYGVTEDAVLDAIEFETSLKAA